METLCRSTLIVTLKIGAEYYSGWNNVLRMHDIVLVSCFGLHKQRNVLCLKQVTLSQLGNLIIKIDPFKQFPLSTDTSHEYIKLEPLSS